MTQADHHSLPDDAEHTEAFNRRCVAVIEGWQTGQTPFAEAVAQLERLGQEATGERHRGNQARVQHLLGYLQHYRGNLTISIQHYERARAIYEQVGNKDRQAYIDLNQGENYRFKGEFNRALRYTRSAGEMAEALGNMRVQTIAMANEGLIMVTTGQHQQAVRAFEISLELSNNWDENREQLPGILCEVYHGLAVIHLEREDHHAAWEYALMALESARMAGLPLQLGFANRVLGRVLSALDAAPDPSFSSDPDHYFHLALESFREINAEAEIARTMFEHALSQAQRGRRTTAARKLQQALIIFTRLGMVDDAARAADAQLAIT